MNKVELADNFASIWKQSREDANKSQDYMAKALGVSKKTIQNWEMGYSSPSILTSIEWFDVLGVPGIPYFLKVTHPERFSDIQHTEEITNIIKSLSPHIQEDLIYILSGVHGSDAAGVIEMVTAHLHIPLKDRLNTANNIVTDYEMAEAQGNLICTDKAKPDISLIKKSYANACEAVRQGKNSYSNFN